MSKAAVRVDEANIESDEAFVLISALQRARRSS